MPFRPQSLAHRIRRLTDAGVLTPERMCTACGIGRSTLDKIMKGATPSRQTEHSITRVLSYHARRENRHLKIEDGEGLAPEHAEEGIFEATDPPLGQVEIKARNSAGERIGLFQVRADTIDDQLVDDLERWYQRHGSIPLKLSDASKGVSP